MWLFPALVVMVGLVKVATRLFTPTGGQRVATSVISRPSIGYRLTHKAGSNDQDALFGPLLGSFNNFVTGFNVLHDTPLMVLLTDSVKLYSF